jgi:ComF family protein
VDLILLLKELNKQGQIFFNSITDFFLPRFCPSCKSRLTDIEKVICSTCLFKIKRASNDRLHQEYGRKFARDKIISDFISLFIFEKDKELQAITHQLKYNGKFQSGVFLGKLLASELADKINGWKADLIIPVPLHSLKKAERGFNQSFYIAKGINSILNIPITDNVIKRNRYTESQTTMNLLERKENIRNAFTLRRGKNVEEKNIILLDDVVTTGATISECGRILLEKGASKIYAVSLAIAD